MSGCGIFDGPQLSEKCLKVAVFGGLAVPHIWNHYWVGFWGHIYITVELGRTFLSLLLTSDSSNLGRVGFVQIGANLDLFELEMIFLLHPTSSHPTYKPYIFWKILVPGFQNWHFQVSYTQIQNANTQIHKYTNTQTMMRCFTGWSYPSENIKHPMHTLWGSRSKQDTYF